MRPLIIILLFAQILAAQTLSVSLNRRFWADEQGELSITDQGIEFRGAKKKQTQAWAYRDIQSVDRLSKTEFVILTYEDQRWMFGRDREYHFRVTSGEVSDELFEQIRDRLHRPVTNRVVAAVTSPDYELPVKHLHSLGGCAGKLIFTPETISYSTENKEDSREWRLNEEIQSVWSSDPYHLEFHVYENNRREFGQTRIYKFSLKEPLDPNYYHRLKLKLYGLETSRSWHP